MPPDPHPPASAMPATVLINSIPKSGTYFTGTLLDLAGIPTTGIHLRTNHFWDWNPANSLDEIIRQPERFKKPVPLSETFALIAPGHTFAHLDHTPQAVAALGARADIRHIFLVRDLRACLLSSMRFLHNRDVLNGISPATPDKSLPERFLSHLQTHCRGFLINAAKQTGWRTTTGVATFRFEDLVQDPDSDRRGQCCRQLLEFCGHPVPDIARLLHQVAQTPTRTSTGQLSNWRAAWSDQAEELFTQHGGHSLNTALGYSA